MTSSLTSSPGATILIVDDNALLLQSLSLLFSRHNYNVLTAKNGSEAIGVARSQLPDLILLDINMPNMDGFEVCEALHVDPETAHIPTIFLTAHMDTSNVVRGFNLGADDCVAKPFNSVHLLARVQRQLALRARFEYLQRENGSLRRTLNEKHAELQTLWQRRRALLTRTVHEFRTPIAMVKGASDLMQYAPGSAAEQQEAVANILQKGVGRLQLLVDSMQDLSALLLDAYSITLEPTSIVLAIEETVSEFDDALDDRRITVSAAIAKCPQVRADRNAVRKVMRELLSNAIKFTPDGGKIAIWTEVISADSRDSYVKICIQDQGPGIALQDRDAVFEPFHVLGNVNNHTSGRTEYGAQGAGIGLTLVRGLVEIQGGIVEVANAPNVAHSSGGAIISFTVPVYDLY